MPLKICEIRTKQMNNLPEYGKYRGYDGNNLPLSESGSRVEFGKNLSVKNHDQQISINDWSDEQGAVEPVQHAAVAGQEIR
jgi:hypothetical protein